MPWKCPACSTAIAHGAGEMQPVIGVVYRCHVCRLELSLDPFTGKLALTPLPSPEPATRKFTL